MSHERSIATPIREPAAGAETAQMVREAIGADIELAVRELRVGIRQRHGLRTRRRLRLEELGDGAVRRIVRRGLVPFDQYLPALGRGEQRELADAALRIRDDAIEQQNEVVRHAADRRRIEEIGVVLEGARKPAVAVRDMEGQVEFRSECLVRQAREFEWRQPERRLRGRPCRVNMTWNSGLRPKSRSGFNSSTSFSNGKSW